MRPPCYGHELKYKAISRLRNNIDFKAIPGILHFYNKSSIV